MGVLNVIPSVSTVYWPADFPIRIPGLVVWWDMSDISTLWKDTGRSSAVTTNGDIVKGVTDKSGTGNHLAEATNGPAYTTGVRNARSVLRFNGTSDILTATVAVDTSYTVFCVVVKRSAITAASKAAWGLTTASGMLVSHTAFNATDWAWFSGSPDAATTHIGTATSWNSMVVRVNSAASLDLYANGGTPLNTNPDDTVTTAGTFAVGGHSGGPEFGDVDIAEVLRFSAALSTTDMNLVGSYLAAKWGLTWTEVV